MSGLVKAKKYDWKDSNLALFGSDTEKAVKKESAESEAAWQGAGQAPGLKIWRIVKFEVTDWPEEDYGKFYSGDSYIILNTYQEDDSEELNYDVHFWIGANSTQDEYGTAAYKTVELDTFLDDKPIQHREVQNHESSLFRTYFPKGIQIMKGGAETGFRHVTPEEYAKRLLHFSGQRRAVTVKEVPLVASRLNTGDVFILDLGLEIFQWNGAECNKDERFKAAQFLQELKSERSGKAEVETIDEGSEPSKFLDALDGEDEDDEDVPDEAGPATLYRVSDADGSIGKDLVKEGDVTQDDFATEDVFLLDIGTECFVWVGNSASDVEKKNGLGYAHKHLSESSHPFAPITVLKEGRRNATFDAAISA